VIDLSTQYMSLALKNPLVASASPLNESMDNLRRMEDSGIAAVVLPSLFEEQLTLESVLIDQDLSRGADEFAEAITYLPNLAEVRHDAHKKWSNPLRISSRSRRVYTTLAVETEAVRKADAQQVEKRFLLSGGLCDPAQSDFAAVCGGQNDVAAVQFG
jgi:hypothetical protein